MKNIAIPLLVAGSANAQLGDMSADKAVMAPTLIATTLLADGCTDDAVVLAKTALATQDGILGTARAAITLVPAGDGAKSPQTIFDEALAARVLASDAVQVAQTAADGLFVTDDAARAAVAAARLALGTAEAIRTAAAEVDRLAGVAKTQAATDLGAEVVQVVEVVEVIGVSADIGAGVAAVLAVAPVAPVAAVAASGATALKATLTTAQAAAVAHVTHERQELAQLECRLNVDTTANPDSNVSRAPAKCQTANGQNTTDCTAFRANALECTTTDGTTGRTSSAAACLFTAAANMLPYAKPTYTTTASTTNCSAPAVDGIARTTDGLTSIPGKPAITTLAAADGLQAIATAKALVLTQATTAPEADNSTLLPVEKRIVGNMTLEQKMAEMTERAFSATRAAGQAGARYREVQSLWTKRVTYDATIAARNNPATAGQEGKADADAKKALIDNPGGALSALLVQTAVTDAAMAVLDVTAVAQYKDNTADADTSVSDADVGAFITLARTLSEATQTHWATLANETYTAVVTATASGAARCVLTAGLDASDATCAAVTDTQANCEAAGDCTWQAVIASGAAGPCDITTATDWAVSIGNAGAADNIAKCKTACSLLSSWSKAGAGATLNLPVPTFTAAAGGDTYCFGYSFDSVESVSTNKCRFFTKALPAGGIARYSGTATNECSIRDKARDAAAYQVAYAAAMVTTSGTAGANNTAETKEAMAIRRLTAQSALQKAAAQAASNLRMVSRMADLMGSTAITKLPGSSTNSCAGAAGTNAACDAINLAGGIALNDNTACVAAFQSNGSTPCVWAASGTNSVLAASAIPAPWGLSTGNAALTAAATAWKGTVVSGKLVADKDDATITAANITAGGANAEKTVVTAEAERVTHVGNYNTALTESTTANTALAANAAEIASTWVEIAAQEQIKLYADAQLARATTVFDDLVTKSTATLVVTAVSSTGLETALTNAQVTAKASTLALTGIDTIGLELEQTPAVDSTLALLNGLRGTFATKVGDLSNAKQTISGLEATIATELASQAALAGTLARKIQACEVAKFLKYTGELATAVQQRADDLKDIKTMLDAIVVPARGAAGARCEKAFSNGTFRPARTNASGPDDKTFAETGGCGENLCCGAAVVAAGGEAVMTIETCQLAEGTTTFDYQPARPAMALTMPATESVPWTCISGAKKLVSAASALAAAVYVLA